MAKVMSDETKARMVAANKSRVLENQAIRRRKLSCGDWKIFRFDADNFALQRGAEDPFYYPNISQSLVGLLNKLSNEKSAHAAQVKDLVGVFTEAKREVLEAAMVGFREGAE